MPNILEWLDIERESLVKMRSLGWALIQHDWCSYRKGKLGHRYTQRKHHMKTRREDSQLQAKERGHRRSETCWQLDLRLPASRIVKKQISVISTIQSVVLCYDSPSKLRQTFQMPNSFSPSLFKFSFNFYKLEINHAS